MRSSQAWEDRVPLVTGGLLSVQDRSVCHALRKQVASLRASSSPWLDITYKIICAESLIALRRHQRSRAFRNSLNHHEVGEKFFS